MSIINELEEPIMSSTQVVAFTDGITGVRKWDASLFDETLIGDRKVEFLLMTQHVTFLFKLTPLMLKLSDIGGYEVVVIFCG